MQPTMVDHHNCHATGMRTPPRACAPSIMSSDAITPPSRPTNGPTSPAATRLGIEGLLDSIPVPQGQSQVGEVTFHSHALCEQKPNYPIRLVFQNPDTPSPRLTKPAVTTTSETWKEA